jgi:hypothetical protein
MSKKTALFMLMILFTIGVQVSGGADFPKPIMSSSVIVDGTEMEPRRIQYDVFEDFLTEDVYSFGNEPNLWVHQLKNSDYVIYYRQEPNAPSRILTINLLSRGCNDLGRLWKHSYQKRSTDVNDDLKVTYSPTKARMVSDIGDGISYLEFGEWDRSLFIARHGRFIKQPISLLRRVDGSSPAHLVILPDRISISIEFAQTDAEFEEGVIIFSDKRLIDIENQRSNKALVVTDMNLVKMLRHDGWWYTTRVGDYKGSREDCYYFNPSFHPSKNLVSWYCQNSNRLFNDIVLTTLRAAVCEMPEEGFYRSEVVPLMFWRWYGMTNGYIDTRFATDGARFLIRCADELKSSKARELCTKLADAFLELPDEQKTSIGDGFLIHDYITPEPLNVRMHTSLNHALCEVNYLLELTQLTGEDKYSELADDILKAIDATWQEWIRPNGDLWYAYFPESDTYGRDDYEELTLMDLRETQALHEEVFGYSRLSIQRLLESKEKYQ